MRERCLLAAAVCLSAIAFGPGEAGASLPNEAYVPVAQSYSSISFEGGRTVGTRYRATNTVTFNSLGFIDVKADPFNWNEFNSPDGLLGSYEVGIWRLDTSTPLTGTLLASTTVTPASPLESFSQFRYAPIPPTTILAGQDFIVAALLPDNPLDAYLVNTVSANATGISGLGSGFYQTGTSLAFPTQVPSGFSYAVANASTTVIPEPATLGLLGLGGVALLRRKRARDASHG